MCMYIYLQVYAHVYLAQFVLLYSGVIVTRDRYITDAHIVEFVCHTCICTTYVVYMVITALL